MTRVALRHRTIYRYDRPVRLSPQVLRLRPAAHTRTAVERYSLRVVPAEHLLHWQQDVFGNFQARVVLLEPIRQLEIDVRLLASLAPLNPFDFFLEPPAETFPFSYEPADARALRPFLEIAESGPRWRAFVDSIDRTPRGTIELLVSLNRRVAEEVRYRTRMEPGVQSCEATLARASGSCRDTAWLLVQTLRSIGLGARFVSGYLIELRADVASPGAAAATRDRAALHAWAEVYLPGAGWVGLDPTSGLLAGEGHIPLAASPDPSGASPVTGSVEAARVSLEHEISVSREPGDPVSSR